MLTIINSCPQLGTTKHGNISCTSSFPKVGSECSIVCSPHYLSSSFPKSSCTWRGVWSEHLECRNQVAAALGTGMECGERNWHAAAEFYPASKNIALPPLPKDYAIGAAGYVGGSLVYCGGITDDDTSQTPISSCHRLTPPLLQWEETFPLLQVIHPTSPHPPYTRLWCLPPLLWSTTAC